MEDISIEEIDALESGGPGNQERPMSATVDEAPEPQEFELEVNGKQIKAPWDKVRQWAQLGYSHPQKMNEFKTKETEFQTERQK